MDGLNFARRARSLKIPAPEVVSGLEIDTMFVWRNGYSLRPR